MSILITDMYINLDSPQAKALTEFKYDIPNSPQLRVKSSPKGSPNTGSLRRRNKSAPRNWNYDHDEREIPTLRQ